MIDLIVNTCDIVRVYPEHSQTVEEEMKSLFAERMFELMEQLRDGAIDVDYYNACIKDINEEMWQEFVNAQSPEDVRHRAKQLLRQSIIEESGRER